MIHRGGGTSLILNVFMLNRKINQEQGIHFFEPVDMFIINVFCTLKGPSKEIP